MQLQQEITAKIHQVLQVEDVHIQPQDNLIEHGLHSLAIMQLVDHFEKRYSKALSYADFAMSPTVQDWHDLIQANENRNIADLNISESTAQLSLDVPTWLEQLPTDLVPLSDMQYAYWAGKETEGVSAHLYMEFEGVNLDTVRLQKAFHTLVQRHPMLNVRIINGQQSIVSLEHQDIHLEDLTHLSASAIQAHLYAKRQRLTHQLLNGAEGHVLDVQLTLLPEHRHVLHIDSDMSAIDPQSFLIVVEDLTALYQGKALPKLAVDQIEYFNYLEQRRQNVEYQTRLGQDQAWWQQQLDNIAPAPQLPQIAEGLRSDEHHFERLIHIFSEKERACLQSLAQTHGVSVRSLCLTLFSYTIASWSFRSDFRLNLPTFIREPYGDDIRHIVGDFTQMSLLSLKLNNHETLLETTKRIERDVDQIIEHYRYGGIHVLRDLSRHHQKLEISPIVFTSALDEGEIFSKPLQDTLGQPIWCISQGPKVDLDVQIAYFNHGLAVNWDIRTHAFQPDVIEAMFQHYIKMIHGLISKGSSAFDEKFKFELPQVQSDVRKKQNSRLPARILSQFPKSNEETQFRVLNELGADCPDWVLGRLILNINQQSNPNLEQWIDTRFPAYFDHQGQLYVIEQSHQLFFKNGYCVAVQDLENRVQNISHVQNVKIYAMNDQQKSYCIALLELNQKLSSTELQTAYHQILPVYLIPEQTYIVDQLQAFTSNTPIQDIQNFVQPHLSIEQMASQQPLQSTALERVVCFIMAKIIGLPQQQAIVDIDFFDEGGDSLLATHLVTALNQYFKKSDVSVVDIFTQRNAKNIALLIEQKIPDTAQRIATVFLQVIEGK